jgi:hypothetical protein
MQCTAFQKLQRLLYMPCDNAPVAVLLELLLLLAEEAGPTICSTQSLT